MSATPRCWKCDYELTGLHVNDACPECGTPVWSQRPSDKASVQAHRAMLWGVSSLLSLFILGPLAALVAIPALVYASNARREAWAGLLLPSQIKAARTGMILACITLTLSILAPVAYVLFLLSTPF